MGISMPIPPDPGDDGETMWPAPPIGGRIPGIGPGCRILKDINFLYFNVNIVLGDPVKKTKTLKREEGRRQRLILARKAQLAPRVQPVRKNYLFTRFYLYNKQLSSARRSNLKKNKTKSLSIPSLFIHWDSVFFSSCRQILLQNKPWKFGADSNFGKQSR